MGTRTKRNWEKKRQVKSRQLEEEMGSVIWVQLVIRPSMSLFAVIVALIPYSSTSYRSCC